MTMKTKNTFESNSINNKILYSCGISGHKSSEYFVVFASPLQTTKRLVVNQKTKLKLLMLRIFFSRLWCNYPY